MSFVKAKFILGALTALFLALGSLAKLAMPVRVLAIVAAILSAAALLVWLWRRRSDVAAMFEANRQQLQNEYTYGGEPWKKARPLKPGAATAAVAVAVLGLGVFFLYQTYFGENDASTSHRATVHLADALFATVFGDSMTGWRMLFSALAVFCLVSGAELLLMCRRAGDPTSIQKT